jgi:hypothetical protein
MGSVVARQEDLQIIQIQLPVANITFWRSSVLDDTLHARP